MSFTSRGSTRFNGHSSTVASLKIPAMIVYDQATKALDTEPFPQNNIAGLISGITYFILFSQEKYFRWKETHTHTHTHTHTQHTHTLPANGVLVELCEKCPITEFFLACTFPHSDQEKRSRLNWWINFLKDMWWWIWWMMINNDAKINNNS